jgi:cobalt-zinc-cadmium resistance protein CzcA
VLDLAKVVQETSVQIKMIPLEKANLNTLQLNENIGFTYFNAQQKMLDTKTEVAKKALLPKFNLQYNYGINSYLDGNANAFQVGVNIPLLKGAKKSKIALAKMEKEIVLEQKSNYEQQLEAKKRQLQASLTRYEESLNYYLTEGKTLSDAILKTANRSFKHGEIDFFQYIQSVETAYENRLSYIENLNKYNQTIIKINYIK